MTGISLFKIVNGSDLYDLTNYIVVPTYKVNDKTEYTEWTDGDLIIHHDELRKRLEGTFTLLFNNIDEYQNFLSIYNNRLQDGYISAYVYDNMTRTTRLANVYLDFELANEMPFMGIKEIDGIEITLKER